MLQNGSVIINKFQNLQILFGWCPTWLRVLGAFVMHRSDVGNMRMRLELFLLHLRSELRMFLILLHVTALHLQHMFRSHFLRASSDLLLTLSDHLLITVVLLQAVLDSSDTMTQVAIVGEGTLSLLLHSLRVRVLVLLQAFDQVFKLRPDLVLTIVFFFVFCLRLGLYSRTGGLRTCVPSGTSLLQLCLAQLLDRLPQLRGDLSIFAVF